MIADIESKISSKMDKIFSKIISGGQTGVDGLLSTWPWNSVSLVGAGVPRDGDLKMAKSQPSIHSRKPPLPITGLGPRRMLPTATEP
jgi:hypothetical protein